MRTHSNHGRHLASLTAQEKLDFHRARNKVLMLEQRVVEKRLLAEATAELLLEALTEDELIEVKQNIVPKLKALDAASNNMPYLKRSVAAAAADVGKFAKKGFFSKLASGGISAISSFLGLKTAENPLLKTMTYLTSLENFFNKFTEIVKKLGKGEEMKQADKKLGEVFDNEEKATLQKSLVDSMTPEGVFSKIASVFGEGIPYLPGGGAKKLVNELFTFATVGDVTNIVKALQTGKKTSELASTAQDLAAAASGGAGGAGGSAGGGAKGGPEQVLSTPVQLAGAIQAQAASQAGKPPPPPEKVKAQASETTKKFLASVLAKAQERDKEVTEKDVSNVVKVLLSRKKFASEFGIKVESRKMARNNLVALSPRDVLVARQLFIESGGSSRRWVKRLLERAGRLEDKELKAAMDKDKLKKMDFKQFKELVADPLKEKGMNVEQLKELIDFFQDARSGRGFSTDSIKQYIKDFEQEYKLKSAEGEASDLKQKLEDLEAAAADVTEKEFQSTSALKKIKDFLRVMESEKEYIKNEFITSERFKDTVEAQGLAKEYREFESAFKAWEKAIITYRSDADQKKDPELDQKNIESLFRALRLYEERKGALLGGKVISKEFKEELDELQNANKELESQIEALKGEFQGELSSKEKEIGDLKGAVEALKAESERKQEEFKKQIESNEQDLEFVKNSVKTLRDYSKEIIKSAKEFFTNIGRTGEKPLQDFAKFVQDSEKVYQEFEKSPNVKNAIAYRDAIAMVERSFDLFLEKLTNSKQVEELESKNKQAFDDLQAQISLAIETQKELQSKTEELEGAKGVAQAAKEKAQELAAALDGKDKLIGKIAQLMGVEAKDLVDDEEKLKDVVKKMIDQKPAAAAQISSAAGGPEISSQGGDAGGKPGETKNKRLADEIKQGSNLLKDMGPERIVAILDAIPEFLLGESLRQRHAMLGRRLLSSKV